MFMNPFLHSVNVMALVVSVEIRERIRTIRNPLVCYHADVGIAHDVLPQDLEAVLCGGS